MTCRSAIGLGERHRVYVCSDRYMYRRDMIGDVADNHCGVPLDVEFDFHKRFARVLFLKMMYVRVEETFHPEGDWHNILCVGNSNPTLRMPRNRPPASVRNSRSSKMRIARSESCSWQRGNVSNPRFESWTSSAFTYACFIIAFSVNFSAQA